MPATDTFILWEDPGTADLWTRAANDGVWMRFNPGLGVPRTKTYVPGSGATEISTGLPIGGNPLFEQTGWFVVDTHGADFIGLDFLGKITQVTGTGALTTTVSAYRMFAQGLYGMDPDGDPDFMLPPAVAASFLDGAQVSPNTASGFQCQTQFMPFNETSLGAYFQTRADLGLGAGGIVPTGTLSNGLRYGWNGNFVGRMRSAALSTTNDHIHYFASPPWERLCLQIVWGITGAATLDTLRMKAQLRMKLKWND